MANGQDGHSFPSISSLTVERGILRDGIAETLRKAIFQGLFRPGRKLNETELATQLRVSRAPLREAFFKLEQEGLVTKLPHKGAVVTEFSATDIAEIYDTRIPLEGYAARLVAQSERRQELVTGIRQGYNQLVQRSVSCELPSYLAADFEFHRKIWQSTGNIRLTRLLTQICAPFFGFSTIQAVSLGKSFSTHKEGLGHQPLMDALERDSPDVVEKIVREIICHNKEEFLSRCYNSVESLTTNSRRR